MLAAAGFTLALTDAAAGPASVPPLTLVSRMRCSAKLIRAFTPVFAGYAERCSAGPGPFHMPESGTVPAQGRDKYETTVRVATLEHFQERPALANGFGRRPAR